MFTVSLNSSCFVDVEYDEINMELTMTFHRGGDVTYVYVGVPIEIYQGFLQAGSHGAYYNSNIRNEYDFR